jgi:hypothetical protein
MVCLRNICVNTLHKGDSVFTNNNNNKLRTKGITTEQQNNDDKTIFD